MSEQKYQKLNHLLSRLPSGALIDAATLEAEGYPTNLRTKYLQAGWLSSPARGVYMRRGEKLTWQSVVYSLQSVMAYDVLVGGRSALELHGYAHYLELSGQRTIFLYAESPLPAWLAKLPLEKVTFATRRPTRLFGAGDLKRTFDKYRNKHTPDRRSVDIDQSESRQVDQPILISTIERSILEMIEELPDNESFHQVDMIFEGLTTARPRNLQKLLERCKSVKTKRLFFFFARRHAHGWLKRLDESSVDLGAGKRSLVKGGKLDLRYQITVPASLTDEAAHDG